MPTELMSASECYSIKRVDDGNQPILCVTICYMFVAVWLLHSPSSPHLPPSLFPSPPGPTSTTPKN